MGNRSKYKECNEYRIATFAKLKDRSTGVTIAVYNTHPDWSSVEARIKQLSVVAQKAQASDADKVVNILKSYKLNALYGVANRVRRDLVLKDKCVSEEECEEVLKIPIIASIPEDDGILTLSGGDLSRFSPARGAIKKLAYKLVKEDYSYLSSEYGKEFSRLGSRAGS